ncbi:hypothetical protein, partial [Salmonella enterica]|uniref:hypothetical protein n=1 Tax=Salmonella enterica TaxID=28901 RepID=UPI003298FC6D
LFSTVLDARQKGFPPAAAPVAVRDVGHRRWKLLAGDLPIPQAVLRESALAHNEAWMRDFTRATGAPLPGGHSSRCGPARRAAAPASCR